MPDGVNDETLERLTKVLQRFDDPNPGTSQAAIGTFISMIKSRGVDLRSVSLTYENKTLDIHEAASRANRSRLAEMRATFDALHIPGVDDLRKLRQANDRLKIDLAGAKEEVRQSKITRKAIDRQVKKLTKLAEAAKKVEGVKKVDAVQVKRLRKTLEKLAPKHVLVMTVAEFERVAEANYGPDFATIFKNDFGATLKPGAKKIATWLKVIAVTPG